MSRIGESFSGTTPDSSSQAASDWVGYVDAFIEEAIDRLQSGVPASAIEMTTDLDFNGASAENVETVRLQQYSGATTTGYLYRASNNDLYYRNGSTDVRLTSGSGVNVSGTGTISGGGSVNYTGVGNYFVFEDTLGGTAADVRVGDVELLNNAETAQLSLSWNGSSNQTITFPSSNPGSTSVVTLDSSGNLAATTTPSVTTLTATNATIATATLTNPPAPLKFA